MVYNQNENSSERNPFIVDGVLQRPEFEARPQDGLFDWVEGLYGSVKDFVDDTLGDIESGIGEIPDLLSTVIGTGEDILNALPEPIQEAVRIGEEMAENLLDVSANGIEGEITDASVGITDNLGNNTSVIQDEIDRKIADASKATQDAAKTVDTVVSGGTKTATETIKENDTIVNVELDGWFAGLQPLVDSLVEWVNDRLEDVLSYPFRLFFDMIRDFFFDEVKE